MTNSNLLTLALSVISGRKTPESLDIRDFEELGYDTYRFGYYGKPDRDELLSKCEGIVVDAIRPVAQVSPDALRYTPLP